MNMRWDLTPLYDSFESGKYTSDLEKLDRNINILDKWVNNNFKNSTDKVLLPEEISKKINDFLDSFTTILKLYSSLIYYAELTFSVDASDDSAKKHTEIVEQRMPDISRADVIFTRWLSEIPNIESIITNQLSPDIKFYLQEKLEKSKYLLSGREELLAAKLKNTGSGAWTQLWNVLTASVKADIKLNGKKKSIPLPEVRNMAYEANSETRKMAFTAEIKAYEKFDKAAAAALNGVKGEVITMTDIRGYESPLDMTLKNSRMDMNTLQAMFTAVREYLPVFRMYLRKKAELLGHPDGLPFYDLFAPMGKWKSNFSYEEARRFIVKSFRQFSNGLADYADNAFEKNWIDAEQREGKRGGAFCENLHVIGESRIMSNFDGSFSGVTTLAHELGHGYHGHCLKNENFLNSDYPMPLAETASIFCETLIIQSALKDADKQQSLTILENSIQSDTQVIVDIYSRYLFESQLFERRKASSLSVEELKEIMTKSQIEAYGNGLDSAVLHPYMWACKPHYYYVDDNFYNFPYAFGLLFAKGLYGEYQKKGAAFIPLYDKLLRETGKRKVADVAKMAGLDIKTPDFWRNSLDIIKDDIDLFIANTN